MEKNDLAALAALGLEGFQSMGDATPIEVKQDPVFGIRIGSFGFLIPASLYCEVLDKVQINPIPNVHPWLKGIVNLRGNFIPVFDLLVILKEQATEKKRKLFAIDRGEKTIALWIDNFPGIMDKAKFKRLNAMPTLPPTLERFADVAYEFENQQWIGLRLADLFKALGRHTVAAEEM